MAIKLLISSNDFFRYKDLYSTYPVGVVTWEWIEHMNDIMGYDAYHVPSHENHEYLFDQFMTRHQPVMKAWLDETGVEHTGFLGSRNDNDYTFRVMIVFCPGSMDEAMFRLRFYPGN